MKVATIRIMRFLLLLAFFVLTHFCAWAQKPRPKWVDDFKGNSSSGSETTSIAVDQQNNIYVTGWFYGTVDFDPSAGVKNLTSAGQQDVFIGKYKQDGTLLWVESIGGSGSEAPYDIAVDKDGNVSVAGNYFSLILDADPGPSVYNLYGANSTNGFLVHLNNNGGFLWAHSLEAPASDNGLGGFYWSVVSDSQDNVITSAYVPANTTVGDSTLTLPSTQTIKYDPSGSLLWSINIQSPSRQQIGNSYPWGIAVDGEDNVVICGYYDGTVNFNPFGTAYNLTSNSADTTSCFIAKYSPSGALIWVNATKTPGETSRAGYPEVCTDNQMNVYFTTIFYPSIGFGTIALNNAGNGTNECIAKYSPSGVLQYAEAVGGPANTGLSQIFLHNWITSDKNENIYLSGFINGSVNFDPKGGATGIITAHGEQDFYVSKYNSTGSYIYAFSAGSPNCDNTYGANLAIDTNNNIDVVGSFCSTVNFDPTGCSTTNVTATSAADPFVAQYTSGVLASNIITPPTVSTFCTNGTPDAISGSFPTGGSGTYTYQWLGSADSVTFADINGATGPNYTPPTITATTYYERIVSSDTCTTPVVSNIVGLHILPTLAPPAVTVGATTSSSVIFTWMAIPGAIGYQVSTDGGQTYTAVVGLTDTVSNLKPGQSVTITVQAVGSISCQLSASSVAITGKVSYSDLIYCPNAFTPNGDGRNDTWTVEGTDIQSLKFSIYDQWGELLFTSTDMENGWDGTYKNTKEPVGIYVYYLEAVMNDGQNIKKKGTITLLK